MNSSDFSGFVNWEPWSRNAAIRAPQKPGIYVFRLAEGKSFFRLKGESDLIYIGGTRPSNKRPRHPGSVRRRLEQHLVSREEEEIDTGYRLKRVHNEIGSMEVAWRTFNSDVESQFHEATLLWLYTREHIELPLLNRQESGKNLLKALRWLASQPSDEKSEIIKKLGQGGVSTPPKTG